MYQYGSACVMDRRSRSCGWRQEDPREEGLREGRETPRDGIRHDLVARVRREIAAGSYDTPEKLERALERMIDQFGDF